jgi:hypothetical protein
MQPQFWRTNLRLRIGVLAATFLCSAAFLFVRLGHYALWDDEANTALIGQGVWRTGDTSAIIGSNIVAYRGGVELSHLKERYLPPLQYYVAAPFVGLWPRSAWSARCPFALLGFLSILLIFWWAWREQIRPLTLVLTAMAFVGNVSLWLYLRQCRYYSLTIFFSLAIAYLYLSNQQRRRSFPLLALLSLALLASNYLNYAALYGVLAIDWLIFSRKRFPLNWRDALWLFIPQLVVGGCILCIWNPLSTHIFGGTGPGFVDRFRLFWWAWRDLNRCEFGALVLLIAAPVVAMWRKDRLLLRTFVALLAYVLVVVALTPQNPSLQMNPVLQPIRIFDVRYLAPAIPLIIAVEVLTIVGMFRDQHAWLALTLGAIAFGTNVLNGGFLVGNDAIDRPAPLAHSAVLLYANELLFPGTDPYTLVADWINRHVSPGQTILVLPDYMAYPLMFHAPGAIYAWQLPAHPPVQFQHLNPALYYEQTIPDYLICFGPDPFRVLHKIAFPPSSIRARKVATIDFYWHDLFRPEIAWRVFAPVKDFRPQDQAIQIFRLGSDTPLRPSGVPALTIPRVRGSSQNLSASTQQSH